MPNNYTYRFSGGRAPGQGYAEGHGPGFGHAVPNLPPPPPPLRGGFGPPRFGGRYRRYRDGSNFPWWLFFLRR